MAAKSRKRHRTFRMSPGKGEHDYLVAASGAFFMVAFGHALRIFYNFGLMVGGHEVPMWLSWVAVIVAGVLSWKGWQYARR